jgi:hypothetical protein
MIIQSIQHSPKPLLSGGISHNQKPLFFGSTTPETDAPIQTPKKVKSNQWKWFKRILLGSSILGLGGVGVHIYQAIPVIRSTALNPNLSGPQYQEKSASEKQTLLWNQIQSSAYKNLPLTNSAGVTAGNGFCEKMDNFVKVFDSSYIKDSFDLGSDVRPPHHKLFHPFGASAKVEIVPKTGHPYTGLFKTGGIGIARLSLAADDKQYAPGIALKFLIDGKPSKNTIAVPNLEPQVSRDFFEQTPSNIFPEPTGNGFKVVNPILIREAKVEATNRLPVSNLSTITPDGKEVSNAHAPQKIEFRPASVHFDPKTTADFREDLAKIPTGSILYEIWGKSEKDETFVHLADVKTTSSFVASSFGDQELNFQHPR